jgi:hypothetical protein
MRKAIYVVGLFSLVSTVFAADPQQATDPHIGTWELNLAKSKFSPGPPRKSVTRIYEIGADNVKLTQKIVDADEKPVQAGYTAKYDGKDYPLTGIEGSDTISLKRVDAFTFDTVQKKDGKVVITGRNSVSRDGKVMTVTSKGTNAKGQKTNNIQVLDKQ